MLQMTPGGFLKSVVEDTSPQLGGDLDGQSTHSLVNMVSASFSSHIGCGTLTSNGTIISGSTIRGSNILGTTAGAFGTLAVAVNALVTDVPNVRLGIGTATPLAGIDLRVLATGARESVMRSFISDAQYDTFGIGNGTSSANKFVPVFYGLHESTNQQASLTFRGFVLAADDASDSAGGGIIEFACMRTNSNSNPLAGVFADVQKRKLFTFANRADKTLLVIAANKNVGFGIGTPTAKVDINSDILRLRTAKTPATAGAAGNAGDICWDADYLYACVASNTWKRSAIGTW